MTMKYDQNLRKAMAEIQAIMKKYDCAGVVSLQSENHGEFLLWLEASWSLIEMDKSEDGRSTIKFKMRHKMQKEMDATAAFVYANRDLFQMWYNNFDDIACGLEAHAKVTHQPIGDRINNDDRDAH